jgi:predicted ATPase
LERTTAYHAWRPVFHRIFKLDAVFHDPASLRAHVWAQLPTLPSERGFPGLALRLSPLLNPILPFEFPESEMTQMMDPIERQRTARQFMLRLIENEVDGQSRRTDRPRLLIMDSSQWLDEDSWELLRLVSQRIKSLFIIVATRPLPEEALASPLAKACLYFLESNDVQHLSLSFLSQEQITALLCRRKGFSELPEAMSGTLARRTGGHPLYSEELTAQWLKSKLIRELNGSYELMGDSEALALVPVPERIQKAITGRLDNLPPSEMLILKTASTIGTTFTRQELDERYPILSEREQLTAGLAHLEKLGLIYETLSAGRPAYTFAYGLIREVAYNLLPFGSRARLRAQFER